MQHNHTIVQFTPRTAPYTNSCVQLAIVQEQLRVLYLQFGSFFLSLSFPTGILDNYLHIYSNYFFEKCQCHFFAPEHHVIPQSHCGGVKFPFFTTPW